MVLFSKAGVIYNPVMLLDLSHYNTTVTLALRKVRYLCRPTWMPKRSTHKTGIFQLYFAIQRMTKGVIPQELNGISVYLICVYSYIYL